jgi:hypothetical protein
MLHRGGLFAACVVLCLVAGRSQAERRPTIESANGTLILKAERVVVSTLQDRQDGGATQNGELSRSTCAHLLYNNIGCFSDGYQSVEKPSRKLR